MTRRKKIALVVPASAEEATLLLAEYVGRERDALEVRLRAEQRIGAIEAARDVDLARFQAEQEVAFLSLKAWWEAGGRELAKDRRSVELAGAKIGLRLTPPKVKFAKGVKAEAVVTWLRGLRWRRKKDFLRTKVELDKQAIIKAAQDDEAVAKKFVDMLAVLQDDEFFVDAGLDEDGMRAALAGAAA